MRTILNGGLALLGLATVAVADVPKVATDIAPVHSLVAQVMKGVGEPVLLVDPGASPHGYALRPSQARALSRADMIFWVGEALTPWLHHPLETLAENAISVELMELPSTITLEFREDAGFEEHDHGAHADHESDEHEHHEQDDHGHEGIDPHGWLDPENARSWIIEISDRLSSMDPENAPAYARNAAEATARLDALIADLSAEMSRAAGMKFVVFHDAFHYFERRFGLSASGAITLSDASDPSAGRVAELRSTIAKTGVTCVFAEPQFNLGLIRAVAEGGVRIATVDPMGVGVAAGPDLYDQMMRGLSAGVLSCLE